ncbi:MAG: hypothetical protein Q8N05_05715 [Bacteroidota bacterium]|nr:hypothetical protein [Bacteroidota bacterium]
MKCYYAHPKGEEKVLIPGCWQVAISGNIEDCDCPENPHLVYIEQLKNEGKIEEAEAYRKVYNESK